MTERENIYYYTESVRIAMRVDEVITWLLSDHINSTSITVDGAGDLLTTVKYTAFGEVRSGDSTTDYQYTGQRNEAEIGLYYYVARFYDPQLARFISADTIIPEPGSIKGYDRYAYVNGNPISFNDLSGHRFCDTADGTCDGGGSRGSGGVISYNIYQDVSNISSPAAFYKEFEEVSFQLLPVFDDFYYTKSIEESFSGFKGSGEANNGFARLGNGLGVINDALFGFRPGYYKFTSPYDQIVRFQINTSYTDTPSVSAKKLLTLSGLTIKNNSQIPYTVNYFINSNQELRLMNL